MGYQRGLHVRTLKLFAWGVRKSATALPNPIPLFDIPQHDTYNASVHRIATSLNPNA